MAAAIVTKQIVEFIYEFDYFTARDEFATEAAAEAETAQLLSSDPAVLVAYLESFGTPVAEHLIERINAI